MRNTHENGRSMIEMLGVLAIIGVLTVGSLSIVGKARQQFAISQIITEATSLIDSARKMSCDYDDDYGTYANMLYLSGAFPDGVTPNIKNNKAESFTLTSDTVLELNSAGNGSFSAVISNMPEETCVAIVTSDWNANGLVSASMGGSSTTDKIIDLDTAATKCSTISPTLTLTFKGCTRGTQSNSSGE